MGPENIRRLTSEVRWWSVYTPKCALFCIVLCNVKGLFELLLFQGIDLWKSIVDKVIN